MGANGTGPDGNLGGGVSSGIADIRCPECRRWLSEARDYGRAVCPNCGWEITIRSRQERLMSNATETLIRPALPVGPDQRVKRG